MTPHEIQYHHPDGKITKFPPSGEVLRIEEMQLTVEEIDLIKIQQKRQVNFNCPILSKDVMYIVSMPVAQLVKRVDFIHPDSVVRNEEGQIVGCKAFSNYSKRTYSQVFPPTM